MRFSLLIISSFIMFQFGLAQNSSTSSNPAQGTTTINNSATPPTITQPNNSVGTSVSSGSQIAIVDYQSVYEAPTLEEELKMAAERFSLTPAQQDVWQNAAVDRRAAEKKAGELLAAKDPSYGKDAVYKGLRMAQNTFYETIIGYLTPSQKQSMEEDRAILEEKRKRLAKIAPPAPTVTVAPVDSAAIKEAEKAKEPAKKPKKKKKAGA